MPLCRGEKRIEKGERGEQSGVWGGREDGRTQSSSGLTLLCEVHGKLRDAEERSAPAAPAAVSAENLAVAACRVIGTK